MGQPAARTRVGAAAGCVAEPATGSRRAAGPPRAAAGGRLPARLRRRLPAAAGYPPPGYPPPGYPPGYGAGYGPPAYAVAPRPGVVPLRPLGLGEVLDGAFRTLRRYPRATLGLTAIVVVIQQALSFVVNLSVRDTSFGSTSFEVATLVTVQGIAVTLVNAALSALLAGMITVVVGDAVLGRPEIRAGDVWARSRPLFWRMLGAAIIAGVLPYLGLIAFIVGGVFLWGALALTMPALVLERTTVRQAVRRSWRLAVPDWWRVFGFRFVATLIATMVAFVLTVPGGVVAAVLTFNDTSTATEVPALAVLAVFSALGALFTEPFLAAVLALIYIDRRIRAEALDVTLIQAAQQPPGPGPGQGTALGAPPPPPTGGW